VIGFASIGIGAAVLIGLVGIIVHQSAKEKAELKARMARTREAYQSKEKP